MPVYTFPTTIYTPAVVNAPFTNDEIECKVDQPTPAGAPQPAPGQPTLHFNKWRAWLKLTVHANNTNGLHGGKVSITVPRCTPTFDAGATNPLPLLGTAAQPAGLQLLTATGNSTATWTFTSAAAGTYYFYVDFAPPPPPTPALTAAFDVAATELGTNTASATETFLPQ